MSLSNFINRGMALVIVGVICSTAYGASEQPTPAGRPVNKAKARVILTDLKQTYDGEAKRAKVKTEPEGLSVNLTYDGSAAAPVNAGTYRVVGTVQDDNYEGSAVDMMTIAKAPQSITFTARETIIYGDRPFSLFAVPSSGLPAAYDSSDTRVATINGNEVRTVLAQRLDGVQQWFQRGLQFRA